MIDAPFESNTTVAEEHFSSKNIYTFCYCSQSASINSHERVVKQQNKLKSLKEVILPDVSKLNESAMKPVKNNKEYSVKNYRD